MSVNFNSHLASIPGYTPGVPKGHSAEDVAGSTLAQLASNESPYPPLPEVVQAINAASDSMNRYPDPDATLLRRRLGELHGVEPERIAVANGSCEILLAAAEALLRPGTNIVYAWPAFSMYPMLASMRQADEIQVPLAPGELHDLDAMLAAITDETQLVLLCNPNNPTGTYIPFPEVAAFVARVPSDVTVLIDEAYIEFQLHDQSDSAVALLSEYENVVLLRSFSKSHSLAGLRVGYAMGSPAFRAAVDAVRQPFSVNALAQAAAVEALRHGETIQAQIRSAITERTRVEEGFAAIGLETADTQANFSWVSLGENGVEIEDHVIADLAEAGIVVRAGRLLGGPGWLRISYGTPEENDRLLAALGDSIHRHS
ncbi:MAG: histidinol-phosphate transaminase [Thermoleophilia bacterium]|nr:histidinol-phosphate transaminase [Thermoleophilia bacterium]